MAAILLDKPIGIQNSQLTLGQHVPSSTVCNASSHAPHTIYLTHV